MLTKFQRLVNPVVDFGQFAEGEQFSVASPKFTTGQCLILS